MHELPEKHNVAAKVFLNRPSSGSNISSVSPCDLIPTTQQLEKGQEREFQYHTGQRIKAIWDGKYFKVKNPGCSNQGKLYYFTEIIYNYHLQLIFIIL